MKNSFLNFEIYRWNGHFIISQSWILKSFPQTTHLVFLHLLLSLSSKVIVIIIIVGVFLFLFVLVWQTFRITSVLWASLFKCFLNLSKHSSIMCSLALSPSSNNTTTTIQLVFLWRKMEYLFSKNSKFLLCFCWLSGTVYLFPILCSL